MKNVVTYLGAVLKIYSLFLLLPIVAAMIVKEDPSLFIISVIITLIVGICIQVYAKRKYKEFEFEVLSLGECFLLTGVSFIVVCIIGCIPFLWYFGYNILDALFASVSGFTTTGMGMFASPFALPKSLLLWYSETQWIGGLGIIVLFLFLVTNLIRKHESVAKQEDELETHYSLLKAQGYSERFEVGIGKVTTRIFYVYLFFTAIGFILLTVAGLGPYESIVLTFSTISTGGFSNLNVMEFFNTRVIFVLCSIMLIGAISFLVHLKLLRGNIRAFFANVRFYVLLIIVFTLLALSVSFKPETAFYVVSALTTTGHTIPHTMPPLVFLLIVVGMLIGGGVGSTAGGMKVSRVYLALKSIGWHIKKLVSPKRAVIPLRIYDTSIDKDTLLSTYIFMFTYLIIVGLAGFVFVWLGFSLSDSFFNVASAIGNVGFTTIVIPDSSPLVKLLLMGLMVLGRLEVFPVLVMLNRIWFRIKKNF
ncbi:hypothetical protein DRJ48_02785 [Candidatus Woesearchaeota archaeon]|nr:MAG: hypothetical protein DRJ48_02785 [Candidatus Woesearchaeota archaeon]